ncbi:cation-translocating P-type ATPase [Sphingosinicella humi]|nr:HAD-IC family P-type ATPase [Sphingosinicella humi]
MTGNQVTPLITQDRALSEGPCQEEPAIGPWHSLTSQQCLQRLATHAEGLTSREASDRLTRFGRNIIPAGGRTGLALLFVRQFRSPLIYLLLGAVLVSVLLDHGRDAIFIAVVLMINATIGSLQEYRAETSMAALRRLIRQKARVRRDGASTIVEADQLVPGDIVEVESGVAVSADLRLLWSSELRVNESTLTGESLAVRKEASAVPAQSAGTGDRPNMLHAGTTVEEGRGVAVAVATGLSTVLGEISASLGTAATAPPPLVLRLERLARQIAIGTVALIALLAILLGSEGEPFSQILLLAVALAVSAIPEGLPIAVTVALSAATRRMAARNVIVRTLPAVEGLGACTLIASDKTGTLTQNRLSVERVSLPDGRCLTRENWHDPALKELAKAVATCNEAAPAPDGAFGDSVDVALAEFVTEAGIDFAKAANTPRIAMLPYEPARRFAAAAVGGNGAGQLYVKGAPEVVLPMCELRDDGASRAAVWLAEAGYRVLAVAGRALAPNESIDCGSPHGLRLLGWVGLLDPIRPEAPAAIARCAEAGIKVRMITGDHPGTALTIARQLGLTATAEQVVTGQDLGAAHPERFAELVAKGRVFARIEPTQKLRIVETLSAAGELVAVTGDGVNDAPALKAAHIGVAMGRAGTDVARGASDLVLSDDNFASIVAGIEEGRITYANIRKIVIFLLATGIAEIFMFIGAVGLGLPMPLTPVQLLWSNLVTNGAQDVMLGFGRGEGDELRRRPRRPNEPIIDGSALVLMLPPAATMSVLALAIVQWGVDRGMALAEIQNAVLLMTVLFQNAYVLCMRSEHRPLHREPPLSNRWLLLGVGLALSLHLLAMHWSPLRAVLGTGPVEPPILVACLAGMALIVIVTEATKLGVTRFYGHLRIGRDAAVA